MSECPGCGQKARHLFLKVPWDGSAPSIVHACENANCALKDFSERLTACAADVVAHIDARLKEALRDA